MKSSMVSCIVLSILSSVATAAPWPQEEFPANTIIPESVSVVLTGHKESNGTFIIAEAPEDQTSEALQRRDPNDSSAVVEKRAIPFVAVAGIAGAALADNIVKAAIDAGASAIRHLTQWNSAREAFTKRTTNEMWRRNPNYNKYPAAICYNKGYHLQDSRKIAGKRSAKFNLGWLNTNYDCMYMEGGNSFYTHSEGGFINLAYTYNKRCTHNRSNGDLTCR